MPTPTKNYYRILQVDPTAEQEVIEGAYRRLASKYHPDKNPSPDATRRMQEINEAYETLCDPIKRAEYDRERRAQAERQKAESVETERRHQAQEPDRSAEYEQRQREQAEVARRRAEYERQQRAWGETKCPRCGLSDKVLKVSDACAGSQRLAPPNSLRRIPGPFRSPDIWFFLVGIVLFYALMILDLGEVSGMVAVRNAVLILGIVCGVGYFCVRPHLMTKYNRMWAEARAELERAKARWGELYYCERDDGVFDPKEKVFIPVSEMMNYLYQ